MYANLLVSVHPKHKPQVEPDEVYAWAVNIDGDEATIMLDANDGESNYAVEAGQRVVDLRTHTISIAADF